MIRGYRYLDGRVRVEYLGPHRNPTFAIVQYRGVRWPVGYERLSRSRP